MFNPLGFLSNFIKSSNQRELGKISKIVKKVNDLEESIKNLENLDFPKKLQDFKLRRQLANH